MALWRWWRALPVVARDGAGAALLTALVVVEWAVTNDHPPVVVPLLAAAAAVTLAWRRQRPAVPLLATAVSVCVAAGFPDAGGAGQLGALVAVYSAVAWGRRRLGLVVAAVEAGVLLATSVPRSDAPVGEGVAIVLALYGIAVALALAAGSRRQVVDDARERAERAEATREVEAARRVAQERLRIARELHDVIGHHVAVVGVQAAVASRLMATRPEAAQAALEHVQDASEAVLSELGALVRVLREPGEDAPAGPRPGLDRLDALLDEARAAGLTVRATTSGGSRPLPPVVDLAAYRIVQESLTNARKHGTGSARLELAYEPQALVVRAANAIPSTRAAAPDGGFGLVGLRERAESLGGDLTIHTDGGTFELVATLPVPQRSASAGSVGSNPQEDA